MQQDALNVFEKMPVKKAVIKNIIPSISAMLLVLIYNLADTIFIGQTGDVFQVAAISLAMPVFMLFMSLGTLFGIGGTSVISRAMGMGNKEYAKKVSAFCFWASVFVGISISALLLLFMDDVLGIIGASSDSWDFTKNYLSIVAIAGPFLLVSNSVSNIIRAEGQASKAIFGVMLGNIINIVLDPILILVFDWGITGAAIATVIGNVLGGLYYILYFLRGSSILSISIKDFAVKDRVLRSVLAIGVPASLGTLIMSFSQIIMNGLMSQYRDMAVGVAMKITMIIAMVSIGLGQGVQPLLGYCVDTPAVEISSSDKSIRRQPTEGDSQQMAFPKTDLHRTQIPQL